MGSKNDSEEKHLCRLGKDLDACLKLADDLQLPMVAISICDAADKVRVEIDRVKEAQRDTGRNTRMG